jgi:hypothetical protein
MSATRVPIRSVSILIAAILFTAAPWRNAGAEPPSAVRTELERLEREKEEALRPVILASQHRLAQMYAEFTNAGQQDEAAAAKAALQQLQATNGDASPLGDTQWSRKADNFPDTGHVKLLASGLAKSADGNWEERGLITRWEHVGGRVVLLTIEQGRSDQLCEVWIFDSQWKSYKGYSFEGVKVEGAEVREK